MKLTDIKAIVTSCRNYASSALNAGIISPLHGTVKRHPVIDVPWDIFYDFEEECLREVWMYSKQPGRLKGLCIWRNGINVNERYEYDD